MIDLFRDDARPLESDGRHLCVSPVRGRPLDWHLEVIDDKTGRPIARHVVQRIGYLPPDVALRGNLVIGRGQFTWGVLDWRTGKWWWLGPSTREVFVSPDRRYVVVKEGERFECRESGRGQVVFSRTITCHR